MKNIQKIIEHIKTTPNLNRGKINNFATALNNFQIALNELVDKIDPTLPDPTPPIPEPKFTKDPDFKKLKTLLHSDKWPKAIPEELICNEASEEDKMERASGIVDLLIEKPLKDKAFLDYGCGEGHIVKKALEKKPQTAIGYDIEKMWADKESKMLKTNFETIQEQGPYDVILLYDVIDHVIGETAEEMLTKIKSLIKPGGSIYVRCHPWCGRHGGHLYKTVNKAFAHFLFSEEELNSMGYKLPFPTDKSIFYPIGSYQMMFKKVGLEIEVESAIRDMPEKFFSTIPEIIKRGNKPYPPPWTKTHPWPQDKAQCSFVDYVLKTSSYKPSSRPN